MRGKSLFIIITILIIAFVGYLLRVAFVGDPLEGRQQIAGLRLIQNEFTITATWNKMDCDGYDLNIYRNGQFVLINNVKENSYDIPNVTPGERYKVTVKARSGHGLHSASATETVIADKAQQAIGVNLTEYYGFTNNDFRLKASAEGEIEFHSADKNIAEVDADGKVLLKERGETTITITASGNNLYDEAQREISVYVYPETLDKVKGVHIENISGSRAVITWKQDELASAYTVFKKDPVTGDYEKVADRPAEKNYYEVTRTDFDYVIKGMAEIADKKIDGRASDPAEIRGTAQEAPSYTTGKIIKTLDGDSLELVAVTQGTEKTHSPQSISLIDGHYVVTFVNSKGNKANLISYDRDGNVTDITKADGIGHGNGTAYNPYTKKLYITKTQKNASSTKCGIFDGGSKQSQGSFDLPKYTSGMAYDVSYNKYYLSKADRLYICDSNFNVEKKIMKTIRFLYPQDIGAYNGTVLVCTWVKKKESYIDMYRTSDGAYIGSYLIPMGEIESCTVDDGYLVILVNKKGSKDRIYRTKKRIELP